TDGFHLSLSLPCEALMTFDALFVKHGNNLSPSRVEKARKPQAGSGTLCLFVSFFWVPLSVDSMVVLARIVFASRRCCDIVRQPSSRRRSDNAVLFATLHAPLCVGPAPSRALPDLVPWLQFGRHRGVQCRCTGGRLCGCRTGDGQRLGELRQIPRQRGHHSARVRLRELSGRRF